MSRKGIGAIGAVLVLFLAAYVGSPYLAARQLRAAALSGDVDRIEAAIDFPAVRESLKSQLTVALTTKMNDDPEIKSNFFGGLGMMMLPAMVNRMVDSFVTPDGMAAMMKHGDFGNGAKKATEARPDYSYDWRGLDRFAVTIKAKGTSAKDAPSLIFERKGLFSWKLIRLQMALESLEPAR